MTSLRLLPDSPLISYKMAYYIQSGTGNRVEEPTLSGTGTPSPSQASLPESTGNPLLNFKNAIAKIDEMARQNRNEFASSLAGAVPEGTLNASSFGDIVQMLNRGGSKYASETAANALDTQKVPDLYKTTNDQGVVTAIDNATGKIVWQSAPGVGNVQDGGGGDTLAERNALAISKYSSSFAPGHYLPNGIPTIDSEGYITPEAWRAAIAEAPSKGLTREEFIKQFGYKITTQGQVSDKYGLTPVEKKLLLVSGDGSGSPW